MPKNPMLETIATTAAAVGDFWITHFTTASPAAFDQKSQDMFERFADQMQCMIYRCDVSPAGSTVVTYSNAAAEWIYELTVEELKTDARSILTLVHPDDYNRVWKSLIQSHVKGVPWHDQYRVVLPKKGCCWREARATVERLESGATVWHGFIWDISERKLAEERQDQFFAMMSHELRTPISGVLGYADVLGNTQLDSEQREYVKMVQQSGDHLLSLINDLLDLSKLKAGRFILQEAPFSIENVCLSSCQMVHPQSLPKGIRIALDLANLEEDRVQGDSLRLTQVLTNLLINAVKHGARSAVRIRAVSSMTEDRKNAQIVITVDDDGDGIPDQNRSQIFQPYLQLENTSAQGTGLGLPLARDLVRQMEGDITVRTSDLGGASFEVSLTLPVAE